ASASIVQPIRPPTSVASRACFSESPKYAAATSTSSEMPRLSQSRKVSSSPSTRSLSGTGSIPQFGASCRSVAPFAGMTRIRFCGCVLSRRAAPRCSAVRLAEETPHDEREDPAVAQVLALARRVEADDRADLAVVGSNRDLARLAVLDAEDRELLPA